MTHEELRRANEIKNEIERLEAFLCVAEKVWAGRLIKRTSKFILTSLPYGVYTEAEFLLDTATKNKMLGVLQDRLNELNQELANI